MNVKSRAGGMPQRFVRHSSRALGVENLSNFDRESAAAVAAFVVVATVPDISPDFMQGLVKAGDFFAGARRIEMTGLHKLRHSVDFVPDIVKPIPRAMIRVGMLGFILDPLIVVAEMAHAFVKVSGAFVVVIAKPVSVGASRGWQGGQSESESNKERGIFHGLQGCNRSK
jgi:hypothetical protein